MGDNGTFERIDVDRMEQIRRAERPPLHIRWWIVLPLALLLCVMQVLLVYLFEFNPTSIYPIATQIPVISFAFLLALTLALNPLLRLWWPVALAMALCGAQFITLVVPLIPGRQGQDLSVLRYFLFGVACLAALRLFVSERVQKRIALGVLLIGAQGLLIGWLAPKLLPSDVVGRIGVGAAVKAFVCGSLPEAAQDAAFARFVGIAVLLDLFCIIGAVAAAMMLPTRKAMWGSLAAYLGAHVLAVLALFGHAANAYFFMTQLAFIGLIFFTLLRHVVANPDETHRPLRWFEPFNRGEMMTLFAAVFVTAGICTFGLMDQLIPLIATPHNPEQNLPQTNWDRDVIPHLNENLFLHDTAEKKYIAEYRQGFKPGTNLWTAIPWGLWAKPLGLWFIFVFGVYAMFYSLCMMLYDSWARREKLVFPLARLPEDMMHDDGAPAGSFSSTLKSGTFWAGFLFVFILLSYNGACQAEWLRGLSPLHLGIPQEQLRQMLDTSIFKGLADSTQHGLVILISFVAIGIGFLLPLEISASLWIYYLFGMFLFFVAIRTAVGASVKSFSSDWMWDNHFVSSLGAGGLLSFASITLVKLVADKWAQAREDILARLRAGTNAVDGKPLETGRRSICFTDKLCGCLRNFGWGGVLFLASMIVVIGWLWWAHVALHWAMAFMAIVILVAVGLMRVVAEGGVYWFQVHAGPFHLTKMANGLFLKSGSAAKTVVPAAALAPLMAVYSVLFLEIKTYIAPSMMNSFKMQEETRASRRWFHAIVACSIAVTVFASAVALLYLVYEVGAGRTSSQWFFTSGPSYVFNATQQLVGGSLGATGSANWVFYLIGICWVILTVLMRRRFFWWLHPIGFVMMANPLMSQLWFGFFIGWICKKLAVKYGGRHMFARLRPAFIGLFFGHLAACFFWSLMAYAFGLSKVSIDINQYSP